jgi:hypothetical protein
MYNNVINTLIKLFLLYFSKLVIYLYACDRCNCKHFKKGRQRH